MFIKRFENWYSNIRYSIEYVIMGREYRFSKWIMILDDMQYL